MHRNILPVIPYRFKGETVPCPVCNATHGTVVSRMDRRLKPLTTVICEQCGVFYSNPMPTKAELSNYYAKEYRKDYQLALFRPSKKHIQKKKQEAGTRYGIVRTELAQDKLTVLDFGCGSGELVQEFAAHGHDAHGFEPGATYATFAMSMKAGAPAIEIQNADYESAAFSEKQFDAITMLHVLEHIRHPIEALKKAHAWLKDDGILYVVVPDMQGYDFKGFERFHFAHVLGFSRDNLIVALRAAGFRVRREIAGTSIIAEKALGRECPASIDLKATVDLNRAEYGQSITLFAYLKHHVYRTLKRYAKRPRASTSLAQGKRKSLGFSFFGL